MFFIRLRHAGRHAEAKVGFDHAIEGRDGLGTDRTQHLPRRVRLALAVAKLCDVEDDRIRGLGGDPRGQFWQRQTCKELEWQLFRTGRQHLSRLSFVYLVQIRCAGYHNNTPRIRL